MTDIDPNTPVIVGVGYCQEKIDDPLQCSEPYQLMVNAIHGAAANAGSASLVEQLDSISVLQGTWKYTNPAMLIAEQLGCLAAKSILADLGVLQLTPFFELCNAIAAGEQSIGVVTGGEAKYRDLRARITGQEVENTQQPEDTPAPDVYHATPDPFAADVEQQAGVMMPVEMFAVLDSALRHAKGQSVEQHRDEIADLYSGFSKIASTNPNAWKTESVPAEEIRNPSDKNPMLAFPYTKKHNSQWNVNQSVAIIVCSLQRAKALGLNENQWIYPQSAAQSRHVNCLAQQKTLYSHPGTIIAGERAMQLADVTPKDIDVADLYSCFPASVRSFVYDLKLESSCPLSVTGSMAFAGGPFNHGALDGVAGMVEALRPGDASNKRQKDRRVGLVSNISGIFGKQGIAIFSDRPNPKGYGFVDVTEEVAKCDPPLPTAAGYVGKAKIVGYTVMFRDNIPAHAFAYCDTENGKRTVVKSHDAELLRAMLKEEFVGRDIDVLPDLGFTMA